MAKAQKTLSRRVLVTINRGITDQTPALIWQHEIPILEAIHGEGQVQEDEGGAARMDEGFKRRRGDNETLPPSQAVGLQDVFFGDVRAEYDRLIAVYGMHPEVKTSVVEYVYGRFDQGRFATMVQSAELDDLSERQLREMITKEREEVRPDAKRPDMIKQLAEIRAA